MAGKKIAKAGVAKSQPSERRQQHIGASRSRHQKRPIRAEVAVEIREGGVLHVEAPHTDEEGGAYEVTDVFASTSNDWTTKSIMTMANVARTKGKYLTAADLNAAFAFVSALGPQDELEAALAQQMYAAHTLAMDMASSAKSAETLAAVQQYGNIATKTMRTFAAQLEALGKHRRGGEQVVRHVHQYIDNRGGQAIIADTVQTGGPRDGGILATQPYRPDAIGPALLGQDPEGHALPVASPTREKAVSDTRVGEPRRTKGQ